MSDTKSGSFSIDTYLSKQENFVLEIVRRMLQGETRITLLEAALQDMYKRNEELASQVETNKTAFDQAVNGLSAVTAEKDGLVNKIATLESSLAQARADLNRVIMEKSEAEKFKSKLATVENDYNTLTSNYNKVQEQNAELTEKLAACMAAASTQAEVIDQPVTPVEKKKRPKSVESEWIDGKY